MSDGSIVRGMDALSTDLKASLNNLDDLINQIEGAAKEGNSGRILDIIEEVKEWRAEVYK